MAGRVFLAEETSVLLNVWGLVLGWGHVGRREVLSGGDQAPRESGEARCLSWGVWLALGGGEALRNFTDGGVRPSWGAT